MCICTHAERDTRARSGSIFFYIYVYIHMHRDTLSLALASRTYVHAHAERHSLARPCSICMCMYTRKEMHSRSFWPHVHTYVQMHRESTLVLALTSHTYCTHAETHSRSRLLRIFVYIHTDTRFCARLLHNHLYVHTQREHTLLLALAPRT